MKRSSSFIKRKIALILVLLLSIESFAAVVGDNDGAAFITKAEFDSMKNDFQSQLDRYNSSLDNKIDGAIASYLSGVKVAKRIHLASFWDKYNKSSDLIFRNQNNFYSEMEINDIFYQWCCLLIWAYIDHTEKGIPYGATTTAGWGGSAFWSPLDCNDSRRYRLTSVGDYNKWLVCGESFDYENEHWFGIDSSLYKRLQGVVSVFGANSQIYGFEINMSGHPAKVSWPSFQLDLSSYTANSSFQYAYQLNLGNHSFEMPLACNLNWSTTNQSVNPFFDFVNQPMDVSKNIMTLDNDDLNQWTVIASKSEPYSSSGGEIWAWAGKAKADGTTEKSGILRNYFGSRWGVAPPRFANDQFANSWEFEWLDTDVNNYIKYSRPYISTYHPDRITNYIAYQLVGIPVTSYNGMPILSIDQSLSELSFKLDARVYNASNALQNNSSYYLIISNQPFGPQSSADIIASGENDNVKFWNLNTSNQGIKINLDKDWVANLKKDTYLYGRIYSTQANTYAKANIYDIEGATEG